MSREKMPCRGFDVLILRLVATETRTRCFFGPPSLARPFWTIKRPDVRESINVSSDVTPQIVTGIWHADGMDVLDYAAPGRYRLMQAYHYDSALYSSRRTTTIHPEYDIHR